MERVLMWLSIGVLTLAFVLNSYLLTKTREERICTVDLLEVMTLITDNANPENFDSRKARVLMENLKDFLESPELGCSFVFLRGALVAGSNVVDITPQVRRYVLKIQSQTSR